MHSSSRAKRYDNNAKRCESGSCPDVRHNSASHRKALNTNTPPVLAVSELLPIPFKSYVI